jgi:predicted acetyltransferase
MPTEEIRVTPQDWGIHHQLMVDDEEVSNLFVVDRQMRIGAATVRMGGIAGVGTGNKHRKRGYASRVLENSTAWMTENGFDCAMLFGIPDFYHRFGYAVCLPDARYELRTRDAETAHSTLEVRPFVPEDREAILDIYAANCADLTGSIARSAQTTLFPKGSTWESKVEAVVFTDGAGAIQAYAARDLDHDWLRVCEVGVRDLRYAADVARWAADRAVEGRYERVTFLLPPDTPLGAHLAQYGAEQKIRFYRRSDGMGRLLNLESFFAKTSAVWTNRVLRADGVLAGDALRLETDIGGITLVWTGETIEFGTGEAVESVVTLPQHRLMQSAMGYYSGDNVLAFPEVRANGDPALFRALFPRRLPYMWVTDHF